MVGTMKYPLIILCCIVFSIGTASAQDQNAALCHFLEGFYKVVGKYPDSDETYAGTVRLIYDQGQLRVVRRINNKTITAHASIQEKTADKIKVLSVRFRQDGQKYEAVYLIDADLDNYGRLSGYWYREDSSTREPGMEALFVDHRSVPR